MNVSVTTFQPLFEGVKQYVVPLFQRSYTWNDKHWRMLWEDIEDLYEANIPRLHFMGSLVTIPVQYVPAGVSKFLVIDGQQRLTTLYILLCAIRDHANARNDVEYVQEINFVFLLNQFQKGNERHKLLPTQRDRKCLNAIIQNETVDIDRPDTRIAMAYNYFYNKIEKTGFDLRKLQRLIMDNISVVSIVLGQEENPYLVFESLNAKGEPLSSSDLVRNYFFMKIHTDQQEEIYNDIWLPMQNALASTLPEFMRHYIMKDGTFIRQNEVYGALKEVIDSQGAIDSLMDLRKFALYYERLVDPDAEDNSELKKALKHFYRLNASTAYPFLLNIYEDYDVGKLSVKDFCSILLLLENYMIRRFICNIPTNQLNKIYTSVYSWMKKADGDSYVDRLKNVLSTRNYPKDSEIRVNLRSNKLYGAGDRKEKAKIILDRLEQSDGHRELIDLSEMTIEHVMPQTLTQEWEIHLGEDYAQIHELCLNILGNLTLTAYNCELSNSSFQKKKTIYMESNLRLNEYFVDKERWNEEEIMMRAEVLCDQLLRVYPYFGMTDAEDRIDISVTNTQPIFLEVLGQRFDVSSWQDVLRITFEVVALLEPQKMDVLCESFPSLIAREGHTFRRTKLLPNGYCYEANLDANRIYRYCRQVVEEIGLDGDEWNVEYA